MAIDEALLRFADRKDEAATTLRLYAWARPTVSLGYAQKVAESVDLAFCASRAIDLVRRPTGGRAVFHADELTYCIVSNDMELFGGSTIQSAYTAVAKVLQFALRGIGCPAEISPGNIRRKHPANQADSSSSTPLRNEPCFSSTSRFEITSSGRKLVGSAQRRLKNAFLQHGSILIHCDYNLHGAALGADPETLRRSFVGVGDLVFGTAIEELLRRSIPESLQEVLRCKCELGELQQEEALETVYLQEIGRHRVIPLNRSTIEPQQLH